jgi:YggT family protein
MTPITLTIQILRVLYFALEIYGWVLIARVFVSWFVPHFKETSWGHYLAKATDPVLAPFYKIKWLQIGHIHFGYVAAFISLRGLQELLGIAATFVMGQPFTVTALLFLLLRMITQFVRSVFFIYGIIAAVRLVTLFFNRGQSTMSITLDALVSPLARPMTKFYQNGQYAYHFALGTIIVLCIAGYFGSTQALYYTISFIQQIGIRVFNFG